MRTKMTDEQRKIAEDNIKLVYKYLYDNGLNEDEWLDILLEYYCYAVCAWDSNRGALSTLVRKALDNGKYKYIRSQKRKTTPKDIQIVSFDRLLWNEGGDEFELQELYGEEEKQYNQLELSQAFNNIEKKLSNRVYNSNSKITSLELFQLLRQGYNCVEIAAMKGISVQAVSYKIKTQIRPVVARELEGCR